MPRPSPRASQYRLPLLAAAATVLVAVGALLLTGAGPAPVPPSGEPPPGAVISDDDRSALEATPVLRGAEAPAPDPGVTLDDPEAVVRAYLQAAHSVTADDAGHTHLRAAPYAVPGSPPATVGVLVLDAPGPGSVRTAVVQALELVAADHDDHRRGYLATVQTRTGPPGGALATGVVTAHVVVAQQPDGRWLVAAENPENPDLPVGED